MANLFEPEFDESSEQPGFSWRRALLARQAGGERSARASSSCRPERPSTRSTTTSATRSCWSSIDGSPSLRTAEGERVLERGEVVSFPRGEAGAPPGRQPLRRRRRGSC